MIFDISPERVVFAGLSSLFFRITHRVSSLARANRYISFGLCWIICAGIPLAAQSSRGTVTGLVSDSSKAAVASATVELRNERTQVSRSTTTNDAGIYRFDAVDPGTYTIKVSS